MLEFTHSDLIEQYRRLLAVLPPCDKRHASMARTDKCEAWAQRKCPPQVGDSVTITRPCPRRHRNHALPGCPNCDGDGTVEVSATITHIGRIWHEAPPGYDPNMATIELDDGRLIQADLPDIVEPGGVVLTLKLEQTDD